MPDLRGLAQRLRALDASALHVVTLPDFFLDHFVPLPAWQDVLPRWQGVHGRGGGNVPTPAQHFQPGGNAANTALALARLGVQAHLVTRTSPFGKAYLQQTLGTMGVDMRYVRPDGELSVTTALEFHEARPANVMLSDPGSVAHFGPDSLEQNDWTLIEAADLVLLANWSQNRRGTELVREVARVARRANTTTMLDTGDPSARMGDIEGLLAEVVPLADLDVYALNENELRLLAGRALAVGEEEVAAARALASRRPAGTLDLHTARFAASFGPDGEAVVPTFRVEPLRVTGAGDSWNAGSILGHLAGLGPADRLLLANAVAGLYISGKEGVPPTMGDVCAFLDAAPATNQPS
ncbi:MAG TPA: carbohydrate kinase family protein [Candidatus Thermoplasmatota archaeon]|nr:carbohydrate kinase family protein [Candidatus Thermoplasmatota archaeon]